MAEYPDWLPEPIKRNLQFGHDNLLARLHHPDIGRSLLEAEFAKRMLYEPRMEKAWKQIAKLELDPIALYWFIEDEIDTYLKYKNTKKLTERSRAQWEKEVRKKLRDVAREIKSTPYDWYPSGNGLQVGDRQIPVSAILREMARTDPKDIVLNDSDDEMQLQSAKGDSFRKHLTLMIHAYISHYTRSRSENPLIATIVRTVVGGNIDARWVKETIRNYRPV